MTRLSLTDPQLIDYSGEHLLYEVQMFRWLAGTVPPMQTGQEKSAYLESCLINFGKLIYLFLPQSTRPTDVIATDFYDDPTKWNAIVSTSLELARTRSNKEVGHLTLDRKGAKDLDKPWPVVDLYREMRTTAKTFAAGASTAKLSPKVVEWVTNYYGTLEAMSARVAMMPMMTMSNTTTPDIRSVIVDGAEPTKKSTEQPISAPLPCRRGISGERN